MIILREVLLEPFTRSDVAINRTSLRPRCVSAVKNSLRIFVLCVTGSKMILMKKWIIYTLLLVPGIALAYYLFPEKGLPADVKIDKLVVIKSRRIMQAYAGGKVIRTYRVSLGKQPLGDKQYEGDARTPEGSYTINGRNPNSGFHKNLGISYPNAQDRKEAAAKGLKPGGEIKIHGLRNDRGFIGKFHRFIDWTDGCIAVTDQEVDELYQHVSIGTLIVIKP